MIDAIIHFCLSITLIKKITFLLESLFIFWIIVSKHLMNIISSTLSLKNHMYCHVWYLNVNVKNFKFNLHHFNSAQIWLRSYLNWTQTFCLNLTQMWLRCILVSLCIIILNCISSLSYLNLTQTFHLNLTQMWLKYVSILLCIIMLKCISSHLTFQTSCLNLIQMWLRFILVSSVLHHIKMHLHQFLSHFNLHLQFFLILFYFFSSFCKSSILKRKVTVMMSDH